jgi:hypothetical protein
VFRGFLPAAVPTATTRHRSRLGFLATVRQEVFGVSRDPAVGQKRFQAILDRQDRLESIPRGSRSWSIVGRPDRY